jgi:hypothetical protein
MRKASFSEFTAEGHAALSICESLLIALRELKQLSDKDAQDILLDAAAAHRGVGGTPEQIDRHEVVAAIIDRIRTGAHSAPN